MRLSQFVVVTLVALLPRTSLIAASSTNEISLATTIESPRRLLFFEDVKEKSKEERYSTSSVTSGEGGRTGAGGTVVSSNPSGGGTVTVTIYNNNGLFQRFVRWWKRLFGIDDAEDRYKTSSVIPGEGGRVGAGGTIVTSSNNNGGDTITVTIFNNNGLFQRIKRWWKRVFFYETGKADAKKSTRRLRSSRQRKMESNNRKYDLAS
ncbi:unnamed protein product [Phytophthora lilii]|uniref:Unnamed protein product n=1 Tax=Phytophthora lilii TaxID=2077276 RepID=A0A9W6TYP6_9STRA|nr:unnamed protein product [Phytophthora lilii]